MVGVNVPIPVPVSYYSFGGWRASLFGDSHMYGPEGVKFFTKGKVITSRWPDPSDSEINLGFVVDEGDLAQAFPLIAAALPLIDVLVDGLDLRRARDGFLGQEVPKDGKRVGVLDERPFDRGGWAKLILGTSVQRVRLRFWDRHLVSRIIGVRS